MVRYSKKDAKSLPSAFSLNYEDSDFTHLFEDGIKIEILFEIDKIGHDFRKESVSKIKVTKKCQQQKMLS